MTRTERLDPVVQLADQKQQQALKELALSQNKVADEKARLAQLKAYRNEYLDTQDRTDISWPALELQEFNRFVSQLDDTIKSQLDVVRLCEQELAVKRDNWQKTRVNSNAMHKVVDNLQQQELIEEDRTEQKIMDELSQRKAIDR